MMDFIPAGRNFAYKWCRSFDLVRRQTRRLIGGRRCGTDLVLNVSVLEVAHDSLRCHAAPRYSVRSDLSYDMLRETNVVVDLPLRQPNSGCV